MKPNTAEPDWKEIRGWKNQLVHLLGTRGRVTARSRDGMPKPVSNATMEKREKRLFAALNELQRMGYKFKSLDSLQRRHIQALGMKWAKDGHAPSTIQNDLSMLRLLFQWIDKPEIMGESAEFVPSKQFVTRTTNAQYDHSWTAAGVDADRLIGLVSQYDRHVGIQLRLCHAFYLRRQEAVMFKPSHWTKRRHLSNVLRGAAEGLDGPGGRNGWMRPRPGIRTSPKSPLSTGVFCEFRCHEAAVRDLTTPAINGRSSADRSCQPNDCSTESPACHTIEGVASLPIRLCAHTAFAASLSRIRLHPCLGYSIYRAAAKMTAIGDRKVSSEVIGTECK